MEILLVDDEKVTGRLVKKLLERHGYRVRVVNSGDEALELLASGYRPDLILMDVFMPEMSGIEASKRIKSDPSTTRIPLLLFTVLGLVPGIRHIVRETGADGFIAKPFEKDALLERIREHIAAAGTTS
ncbi:MAG: response regulator [Euryarchaeota archaeon]|nr:response regulator [Euryarchaeota archaeon]